MTDELCRFTLGELLCSRTKGHPKPDRHYDRGSDAFWDSSGAIRFTEPKTADDVTAEMIGLVSEKVNGRYAEGRVDWEDVWDRTDDALLDDGTRLDLGTDTSSPALRKLKSEALKRRAE